MPDYAPNFTPRYKLRYSASGHVHAQLWRPPPGAVLADMATFALFVSGYYAAVAPLIWDDTVPIDASFAAENSDIFLPCPIPTIIGGNDAATRRLDQNPVTASFVGRSTAGQRWVIYQYGSIVDPTFDPTVGDYRLTAAEQVEVLDTTSFLNGESGTFVASDGVAVVVKPYINVKANDYWVRKARG